MQASVAIHPVGQTWQRLSAIARLSLFLDTLSVAAPGVAVGWQLLLAHAFAVHLPRLQPIILSLTVWSLYAADHVFDAMRSSVLAWEPARRTFYRNHWPSMALFAIAAGLSALILAVRHLSADVLWGGFALAALVLVYFTFVHSGPFAWRARWPREAVVAAGFAGGTFMPVVISGRLSLALVFPAAILFFCLCWLNCCVVETWEWQRYGADLEAMPHSSTQWLARHVVPVSVSLCAAFLMLHAGASHERKLATAGMASGAALLLIARFRESLPFSSTNLTADLALWTPLVALICS